MRYAWIALLLVGVVVAGLKTETFIAAAAAQTAEPAGGGMEDVAIDVRDRAAAVFGQAPAFPGEIAKTLAAASPEGGLGWLVRAIIIGVVMIAVGFLADLGFRRWSREHFRYLYNPDPNHRREKIGYHVIRAAIAGLGTLITSIVSAIGIVLAVGDDDAGRLTAFMLLFGYLAYRGVSIFLVGLLAYDTPSHRLLPLDDETAAALHRTLMTAATISIVAIVLCQWMGALALAPDPHVLALVLATLLVALVFSVAAVRHKKTVAALIHPRAIAPGGRGCPSSKHLGLLSLFHKGGSGSSWIDVKPLVVDGSSGGVGWSVS